MRQAVAAVAWGVGMTGMVYGILHGNSFDMDEWTKFRDAMICLGGLILAVTAACYD